MANGYADGLTIDRVKNSLGYSPDNCRWVTQKVQMNNTNVNVRIEIFGETKTMTEWSEDPRCKITKEAFKHRVRQIRKFLGLEKEFRATESLLEP